MLTAYLDVSRGADPVYTLGGFVASVGKWNTFREQWKSMLAHYDAPMYVPADLDLKDVDGNRMGTYKGWPDQKAESLQRRAFDIIKSCRRVAVSSTVFTKELPTIIKLGWTKTEFGQAQFYYPTAIDVLKNVAMWIKRYKVDQPIQYIFETGDEGYDEVEKALSDIYKDPELKALHNMAGYARQCKQKAVELQSAGLWAYECYKHHANQYIRAGAIPVRASWKALARHYDEDFNTCWTKDNLREMLRVYKERTDQWELQNRDWYERRGLVKP